jgi:hypothetical protein
MFGVNKEDLLKGIEVVRRQRCCYSQPDFCDCKYRPANPPDHGENTGCPELRMAYKLISAMTPDEFNTLCVKAGILIV